MRGSILTRGRSEAGDLRRNLVAMRRPPTRRKSERSRCTARAATSLYMTNISTLVLHRCIAAQSTLYEKNSEMPEFLHDICQKKIFFPIFFAPVSYAYDVVSNTI